MRRPRYLDFECQNCKTRHTRFVETNDDDTPLAENDDGPIAPERCDVKLGEMTTDGPSVYDAATPGEVALCRGQLAPINPAFRGYMKTITKGNHDFNERERERLEKRGDEHWKREGRHEAIERERAVLKKNGMDGAGGVR